MSSPDGRGGAVDYDPTEIDSIVAKAHRLAGSTLRQRMTPEQLASWTASGGKGDFGLAVEHFYDIKQNSDHEPDFRHVGTELKVAPLRLDPEGLTAKERVSITSINFSKAATEAFEESPVDVKTRRVLFVFYEWEADQEPLDAPIRAIMLWDRDSTVEALARDCHAYVAKRVAAGTAHLITAKHTAVIEPATKGQKGGEWKPPGGGTPAKTRAYAFKRDFMAVMWRTAEPAPPDPAEAAERFRRYLRDKLLEYRGLTVREIDALLHLNKTMTAKQAHRLVADGIITRLRGVDTDDESRPLNGLKQLEALGITPKVVRLLPDGTPHQTPPFAAVGFDRIGDVPFEQSRLASETRELMWILWRADGGVPDSPLLDVGYWRPTTADREAMREDYEAARAAIVESDPSLLPTSATCNVFHVRTKGEDGEHVAALPDGTMETRKGFYMIKPFAKRVIAEARATYGDGGHPAH